MEKKCSREILRERFFLRGVLKNGQNEKSAPVSESAFFRFFFALVAFDFEKARDGIVRVNALNGFAEELCNREHRNRKSARFHGNGIRRNYFVDDSRREAFVGDFVEHTVADERADGLGAVFAKQFRRRAERSRRFRHVVNEDNVATFDFADEIRGLNLRCGNAALGDESDREIEQVGDGACSFHATDVRRKYRGVFQERFVFDVIVENRGGEKVVNGNVKEPLNLLRVKVERENAVSAGSRKQVRDEFSGNRHARTVFAVLTGVAEERHDGGDALGGGAAHGVDHDEQFHQVVVGGATGRLNRENVATANVFFDLNESFSVGEGRDIGNSERNSERVTNFLGENGIGVAGEYFHCAVGHWE